jgi:hypothetical protein
LAAEAISSSFSGSILISSVLKIGVAPGYILAAYSRRMRQRVRVGFSPGRVGGIMKK